MKPGLPDGLHADFVLLGGGLASATAAETLRREQAAGSILIVSDEQVLPYHRPPLSTRLLLADSVPAIPFVLPSEYYREHGIDVLLGTRALEVDTAAQVVRTDDARTISYGKLLLATGSRPVRLHVPGGALHGIHYLRTREDALAMRRDIDGARRAVVVGAGFIGMELAAAFLQRGLHVTLLARHDVLFDKLADPAISDYLYAMYTARDMEVLFGDTVEQFHGRDRLEAVVTESGRTIPCELAALGIGVTPNVDYLTGSGIGIDNGVLVNRYLETSVPNVFAAGDVANFFDPVFNVRRRTEHWDNAVKQGRLAAKNMLDRRLPYDEISYFACELFDFGFQFLGLRDNTHERARIGSLQERSCALLYLEHDVPRALFSTGRPASETRAIESLIRYRANIGWALPRIADPGFSLAHIPSQTAFILQGGGALGAFECGVVRALEEQGIFPDIVAGVSIGAFNGAIVAANPRHAAKALEAFWQRLAVLAPEVPDERIRRMLASWQALAFGIPGFFQPRWCNPFGLASFPLSWTSLYDPSPIKRLLAEYVDFGALRCSPVRLLVSAVDVESARLEVFDSYVDQLTPDHILASGSLPPGFPWTTINGRNYWDGGIMSNSPLELLVERTGVARKRIIVVDLFPNAKPLPANLMEVISRRDEIVYTERIRRDSTEQAVIADFRKLVEAILGECTPELASQVRQWPNYIQLMGDDETSMDLIRITREGAEGEPASKDYDFSSTSIARHIEAGYKMAKQALCQRVQRCRMHPVGAAARS